MTNCGVCGVEYTSSRAECPSCGAGSIPEPHDGLMGDLGPVCPSCDTYNAPGSPTCAECGAHIGAAGFTGFFKAASQSSNFEATGTEAPNTGTELSRPGHSAPCVDSPPRAPGPGTRVFGALEPGRGKLVLRRGEGFDGAEFRLNAAEVAAGRARGLILFPDDESLGDLHATFLYRDGSLFLRDEGSASGCWIAIREPHLLRLPEEVAVGDTRLRIQEIRASASPESPRRFGAPLPAYALRIEELLSGERPGRAWVVEGSMVTIGRVGADVELCFDENVTETHAELRRGPEAWTLAALEDTEGTFVRVPEGSLVKLTHEDLVRLGNQILQIFIG